MRVRSSNARTARAARAVLVCGAAALFGLGYPVGPDIRTASAQDGNKHLCRDVAHAFGLVKAEPDARKLNFLLFDASSYGCVDLATQLVAAGASTTARDRTGNTALLIAARSGRNRVLAYLLDAGSDVDHANLAGSTALIRAATANRRKTVKLLLDARAAPDPANRQGITALIAASYTGNRRLVKMLLDADADPHKLDRSGKSAMVYAAGKGFTGIVGLLMRKGVKVNEAYGHGLTALMWAAGHSNEVPEAEGLETVRALIANGAALDLRDDRGRTALMIAAERSHPQIVAHLIEAGADLSLSDKSGKTAMDLASNPKVRDALSN